MLGILLPLLLRAQTPAVAIPSGVYTVPALVRKIKTASGLAIRAGKEVENEVLFISLPPTDPERLLRWVAEADSAEWVEEGGIRTLTRSVTLRRKQEKEDAVRRTAMWRKALATILVADYDIPTKANSRFPALFSSAESFRNGSVSLTEKYAKDDPTLRFFSRIVREIDLPALAKLEIGDRYILCSQPRALQVAIPSRSVGLYAGDLQLLAKSVDSSTDQIRGFWKDNLSFVSALVRDQTNEIPDFPYVLVKVSRLARTSISVEVNVFGNGGKQVYELGSVKLNLPNAEPPLHLAKYPRMAKRGSQFRSRRLSLPRYFGERFQFVQA